MVCWFVCLFFLCLLGVSFVFVVLFLFGVVFVFAGVFFCFVFFVVVWFCVFVGLVCLVLVWG